MAVTKNKLEFAEFIEKIEAIKGRHTELVTVLIPAGQKWIPFRRRHALQFFLKVI